MFASGTLQNLELLGGNLNFVERREDGTECPTCLKKHCISTRPWARHLEKLARVRCKSLTASLTWRRKPPLPLSLSASLEHQLFRLFRWGGQVLVAAGPFRRRFPGAPSMPARTASA